MKKLLKIKGDKKISSRQLAKEIGSSKTTVDNGLQCKTDEFKLEVFLKLVQSICDSLEEQRQIIHEYILLCKTPLNVQKALCYCQAMGEYDLIKQIIEKHAETKGLKKYLSVYKIQNKRNQNVARGQQLLDEIYAKDFSSDTVCQAALNILYMEAMYDKQNYNAVIPHADRTEANLTEIKQDYIKQCLQMKYKERLAYIHLMRNDLERCRNTCYEILDSEMDISIIKATAWCCLGESFTFECPYTAEKYIKKAISLCENIQVPQKTQKYLAFHTTLAHLYIENGINLDKIRFDLIHTSEKAFYECMHGDWEKGIELYEGLRKDGKEFTAFQQYSFSKVNNDIMGLKKSLESFELTGNIFYSQYVKKELLKEEVKSSE
ncbi:AimR family lysis-lysogeny pheromone receptor [Bacillus arachidis]|uniref:AimR family lysis-lysogeny pheromone receptor n=1 Tax=Bacillus arachidis TaxID=2819290 RepID=UPI00255CD4EF|nr:AimR family lysis-lysogeny pheromone receptor [Bacillus arachidis]WIY58962.1 AimR family lysis-lysogeny pheromone receptor [Bacillus arachidis]